MKTIHRSILITSILISNQGLQSCYPEPQENMCYDLACTPHEDLSLGTALCNCGIGCCVGCIGIEGVLSNSVAGIPMGSFLTAFSVCIFGKSVADIFRWGYEQRTQTAYALQPMPYDDAHNPHAN